MLSSQIAVSINNAMLYLNLEQKVEERTNELAIEKQKSDNLLSNILPKEIAEELKETGKTIPKYYESVTVLFADFVGFTHAATKMSASQLVNTIDSYFREFDKIVQKYNLEKIKTIGDAYMCAGGLPVPNSTHAHDAISAAFNMIRFTENHENILKNSSLHKLGIRIGIHTGPLVAGVVGTDKFAYDIWGNTVNKASRLESNGVEGRIKI
jgi:class 3 adenylate cyclase